jgi:hypothetical protein
VFDQKWAASYFGALGLALTLFGSVVALADNLSIPGYTGPTPNVPYLESESQVEALLRGARPEDRPRIIEDYRRRAAPYFVQVPGGRLQVTLTPGGGPPNFVFFPDQQARTSAPDYDMFVSFVDPSDGVHSKVSEATCFEAIEAYMRFGSGSFQMTVTSTTTGKTVRGRAGSARSSAFRQEAVAS